MTNEEILQRCRAIRGHNEFIYEKATKAFQDNNQDALDLIGEIFSLVDRYEGDLSDLRKRYEKLDYAMAIVQEHTQILSSVPNVETMEFTISNAEDKAKYDALYKALCLDHIYQEPEEEHHITFTPMIE